MKSFDKFRKNLGNDSSNNEPEIFDERQKQIRSRLIIESLIIFVIAVITNCIIYDLVYKWSESLSAPLFVLIMFCVLYYIVRSGIKGCFVGVGGPGTRYFASITCIIIGLANIFRCLKNVSKDGLVFIVNNVVSDNFLEIIAYILLTVAGICCFVTFKRNMKKDNSQ